MKFKYYNDTNRKVSIHPATFLHGCTGDKSPIKPSEERTFILPKGTYPWVKMCDYGEEVGLSILVSPMVDEITEVENNLPKETKTPTNDTWSEVLEVISSKVSKATFDTWFKDTNGEIVEKQLTVNCPNLFARDWLDEQYRELIVDTVREVIGEKVELELR